MSKHNNRDLKDVLKHLSDKYPHLAVGSTEIFGGGQYGIMLTVTEVDGSPSTAVMSSGLEQDEAHELLKATLREGKSGFNDIQKEHDAQGAPSDPVWWVFKAEMNGVEYRVGQPERYEHRDSSFSSAEQIREELMEESVIESEGY